MKIITKTFKDKSCCGNNILYQLKGWVTTDWLCANCLIKELMENKYRILP